MNSDRVSYFAYGSNLNQDDLSAWCKIHSRKYPLGILKCKAYLPDHTLSFSRFAPSRGGGVLDVREHVGAFTPGVLFEVSSDGLSVLDDKEGVPNGYYQQKPCIVLLQDGTELSSLTYEVVTKSNHHEKPSTDYIEIVRKGYEANRLASKFLEIASLGKRNILNFLFVYGTLKRGYSRHGFLEGEASLIGSASTAGRLYDYGDYPGMTLDSGKGDVNGELFQMDDPSILLPQLDGIEGAAGYGCPNRLFRRVVVPIVCNKKMVLAWTFVASCSEGYPQIAVGEW